MYNLSVAELQTICYYINVNLENKFIYKSWLSSIVFILFIKKKDGSLRLCVDYQELNAIIVKNYYILLLINETLNYLSTAKVYTKLDTQYAYNLICIYDSNK